MLQISYTQADSFPWKEAFAFAPHLLWATVLLGFFIWAGPSRLRSALSRVTKVGFAGVEVALASELDEVAKAKDISILPQVRDRVTRRLMVSRALMSRARILWVDDNPVNNKGEMKLLLELGASIDLALSTHAAQIRLEAAVYDLILSDMTRGNNQRAGEELVSLASAAPIKPPLIFYVGDAAQPRPYGSFGITASPDELFHLILDALEQRRKYKD